METTNQAALTHSKLNREQRAAYFAWQNCPLGNQGPAFVAYIAASNDLEAFNKRKAA